MAVSAALSVKVRPFKRTRRHVAAKAVQKFAKLPASKVGLNNEFDGPFRSNIKLFLMKYGWEVPLPPVSHREDVMPYLMTSRIVLEFACMDVVMHVIEEDVCRSRSVYCESCRVAGWGGNPVCGKRYHFIIQNRSNIDSSDQSCPYCGTSFPSSDLRCTSCDYMITADDLEHRAYLKLHDSTHLLHGLVHANGYGHLLRLNGREGGSQSLSGSDIMGFWDQLCTMLQVREVTVTDMSKKHEMEYRLLHAVAKGHPWYGEWGYQFGGGSFALTSEAYHNSVDDISNIPLSFFFSHARSPRTRLQNTIALYWSLSDRQILTVRDLFCFVMQLLQDVHTRGEQSAGNTARRISEASQGLLCPWTKADVEKAEDAMIKVLRASHGSQWVSWRALRGATCKAVKSPELLDYCLKGLGGRITDDGMAVAVRCNPDTSCIEYRVEVGSTQPCHAQSISRPSRDQLLHDLRFLYDALLNPATMENYRPETTRESALISAINILNCKQFVKHYYDKVASNPSKLRIWCNVELVDLLNENIVPPLELLVLPINATIASLKQEATKALQETYLIFQRFQAEELLGFEKVSHSTPVMLLLGLNGTVKVRGRYLGVERKLGHLRMERGTEMWIVDCVCRTKDDDGERMLACDSCGVWQHTRCNKIGDYEEVPATFTCMKCTVLKNCDRGHGSSGCGTTCKNIIPNELICKDMLPLSFTEADSTVHVKSCKDEISALPFMEADSTFHASSWKDEIAALPLMKQSGSMCIIPVM